MIRILEGHKIPHRVLSYPVDESDLSALHVAQVLQIHPEQVFKTIVLVGDRSGPLVCVVPGPYEVDLKKAARVSGNKAIEPLPLRELEGLTGYVRGGCSPIGMKKLFPTYIEDLALLFDAITVSAGKRGLQVQLAAQDLARLIGAQFASLI